MRPDELGAVAIKGALDRVPGLELSSIDDVILGCAMPEGEQGMNVARIASLRAGIPVEASAVTINRFCSSGLQAIAYGAECIMLGQGRAAVAGGTESMSMVPMGGNKISPNPVLVTSYPDVAALGGSWRTRGEMPTIVVPLQLRVGEGSSAYTQSWFSTNTSIGTPVDITLEELHVELFHPADEATAAMVGGRTA